MLVFLPSWIANRMIDSLTLSVLWQRSSLWLRVISILWILLVTCSAFGVVIFLSLFFSSRRLEDSWTLTGRLDVSGKRLKILDLFVDFFYFQKRQRYRSQWFRLFYPPSLSLKVLSSSSSEGPLHLFLSFYTWSCGCVRWIVFWIRLSMDLRLFPLDCRRKEWNRISDVWSVWNSYGFSYPSFDGWTRSLCRCDGRGRANFDCWYLFSERNF